MLLSNMENTFASTFHTVAQAPNGVARLRELILTLAVQGKLVAQDASDEPASELLKKIRAEKDRLMAEGKIKKEKPLAAITEAEKPFELPEGWEWVRVCDLNPELQNGASSRGDSGGKLITVIRLADVKNKILNFDDVRKIPISEPDIEKYSIKAGDILVTRVNGSADIVGQFNICLDNVEAIYCDHFIRMRIIKDIISSEFLFILGQSYLIRQKIKDLFITTAGQKTVNQGHIGSLLFSLPPLAEQSRIVARVEALMRLCDALEEKGGLEHTQHQQLLQAMLDSLTQNTDARDLARHWQRLAQHFDLLIDRPKAVDALEQTILQLAVRGLLVPQDRSDEPASELLKKIRAEKDRLIAEGKIKKDKPLPVIGEDEKPFEFPVGWQAERLGNLLNISSGITLGRKTAINNPLEIPYLRVANVQRWKLELNSMKSITIDESEINRYKLLNGDLLITEGGDWDKVGRTAIWNDELPICAHQNHVFKARKIIPEWNEFWSELFLNSDIARKYFASSAKQTTNLASINMTQLKNCVFPLPPLAEQSRIVARVTELRALCQQLRGKLSQARTTQTQLAQAWVEQVAA